MDSAPLGSCGAGPLHGIIKKEIWGITQRVERVIAGLYTGDLESGLTERPCVSVFLFSLSLRVVVFL